MQVCIRGHRIFLSGSKSSVSKLPTQDYLIVVNLLVVGLHMIQ